MNQLPFGLRVLAVFFLAEGAKQVLLAGSGVAFGIESVDLAKAALHLAVCGILGALILLRIPAGRYCSMAYFVVSLTWTAMILAIITPELWVGLSSARRGLVVGSSLIECFFLYYLLGPHGKLIDGE